MALVTLSRLCPIGLCVHVVGRCLVTLSRLCPIGLCVHVVGRCLVTLSRLCPIGVCVHKTKSVDINFLSLMNPHIDLT